MCCKHRLAEDDLVSDVGSVMRKAEFVSHTDTLPVAMIGFVYLIISTYPDYKTN